MGLTSDDLYAIVYGMHNHNFLIDFIMILIMTNGQHKPLEKQLLNEPQTLCKMQPQSQSKKSNLNHYRQKEVFICIIVKLSNRPGTPNGARLILVYASAGNSKNAFFVLGIICFLQFVCIFETSTETTISLG